MLIHNAERGRERESGRKRSAIILLPLSLILTFTFGFKCVFQKTHTHCDKNKTSSFIQQEFLSLKLESVVQQ